MGFWLVVFWEIICVWIHDDTPIFSPLGWKTANPFGRKALVIPHTESSPMEFDAHDSWMYLKKHQELNDPWRSCRGISKKRVNVISLVNWSEMDPTKYCSWMIPKPWFYHHFFKKITGWSLVNPWCAQYRCSPTFYCVTFMEPSHYLANIIGDKVLDLS